MMTYSEYKDKIEDYKLMGLKQFLHIYKIHKDRLIEREQLHWGEEMEYSLFHLDPMEEKAKLADQGLELIEEFNNNHNEEVELHPEFGNWMVEAVPT